MTDYEHGGPLPPHWPMPLRRRKHRLEVLIETNDATNPAEWDWPTLLDLDDNETVRVRRLPEGDYVIVPPISVRPDENDSDPCNCPLCTPRDPTR